MTILIMSLHALIHTFNYLYSFKHIIQCYHIHMIKWSNWEDFKLIIYCYHIHFMELSKYNGINFMTFHLILNHHYIIIIVHWLKINVLPTQDMLCHNSMGLELNVYHHGASKLILMSYLLGAIEHESTTLPQPFFIMMHPEFNRMSYSFGAMRWIRRLTLNQWYNRPKYNMTHFLSLSKHWNKIHKYKTQTHAAKTLCLLPVKKFRRA